MAWLLCLGHALLGALLLPCALLGPGLRRRAVETAAAAGTLLGAGLVIAGASGASGWRTVAFEPGSAVPAGFAVAAAWVLVAALSAEGGRVGHAALVGVAGSGLVLAATGRYVVPALIFWLCSTAALAALAALTGDRAARAWPLLVVSDAAVCAAAVVHVVRADTWSSGDPAGDPVLWTLAGAAVVRGGAHLAAPWPVLGTRAAAAAPLLAGGAVVLAERAARAEPWLALAVLAFAGAAAIAGLRSSGVSPRLLATWPVALAVAVCFVSPGHAPVAGAAAVLSASAAALWPFTAARGRFERALLVAAVPLTAGFAMVAGGATAAFERATESATPSLPWALVAAALPAAFAGGVVLGGRATRAAFDELVPEAVLATWLLLAGSVFVGLAPSVLGGADAGLGASGGVLALNAVALAAGVAVALVVRRGIVVLEPAPAPAPAELEPPRGWPAAAGWAAIVIAVATAGAAAWLTVAGLRVGFL